MADMERLRELLKTYNSALNSLKDEGYIGNFKLVAEIGEFFCCNLLNMRKSTKKNQKGFDIFDSSGQRVEVKARHRHKTNETISNFRPFTEEKLKGFDYALLVILGDEYWVEEIWKVPNNFIAQKVKKHRFGLTMEMKDNHPEWRVYPK